MVHIARGGSAPTRPSRSHLMSRSETLCASALLPPVVHYDEFRAATVATAMTALPSPVQVSRLALLDRGDDVESRLSAAPLPLADVSSENQLILSGEILPSSQAFGNDVKFTRAHVNITILINSDSNHMRANRQFSLLGVRMRTLQVEGLELLFMTFHNLSRFRSY